MSFKYLPAYPHDEKAILVKNTTKITFLWRYEGDEVLVQTDNVRRPGVRGGTRMRITKVNTKEFARKLWKAFVKAHGYTRVS